MMPNAERTLDHWTFARRSLGVLIVLNFPSQLKFAPHLARNCQRMANIQYAKHKNVHVEACGLWGIAGIGFGISATSPHEGVMGAMLAAAEGHLQPLQTYQIPT